MNYFSESIITEIPKLVFIGKIVGENIDDESLNNNSDYNSYTLQFDKKGDLQIKVVSFVPRIIENLFIDNSYILPIKLNKYNNNKKLKLLESGESDLINAYIVFKLVITSNKISVKVIDLFYGEESNEYYVIPIARKRNTANNSSGLVSGENLYFTSYPKVFGIPKIFSYKDEIYLYNFSSTVRLTQSNSIDPKYMDSYNIVSSIDNKLYKDAYDKSMLDTNKENTYISTNQPITEYEFILALINNAKYNQLKFCDKDIINFHISLKTDTFILLDGQRGNGKSELIKLYLKTNGLEPENNMLEIPITPKYTSIEQLFGRFDPEKNRYIESKFSILSFIEKAHKDSEHLYFLILDDLNQSNIDRYLPELLFSIVNSSNPKIVLKGNPSQILILPSNLKIIGTITSELGSYPITPKILDKVNYLALEKVILKNNQTTTFENNSFINTVVHSNKINREWVNSYDYLNCFEFEELKFFDSINDLLNDYSTTININFRILNKMAKYLSNIPSDLKGNMLFRRDKALDILLSQTLIPKIYGSHPALGSIIGEFNGSKWIKGELIQLLESDFARKISSFSDTIQALNKKAKELEYEGYAH